MSKENIMKFQEVLAQKPELLERLKGARTPEAVAAAQAEGFDFTAEELEEYGKAAAPTGKLADDELEKVVGGLYDGDGNLIVTVAYGCQYWEAGFDWIAVKGQCGSCKYMIGASFYSYCQNRKNNEK